MLNVLITGNKGFVGGHFERYLKSKGTLVRGVDIKNGEDCRDFFKKDKEVFDLVIHCAAIVGGRATIEGNPLSVATDLSIDAEMMNWAINTRQKKLVLFSSSAAYPTKLQESPYKLEEKDIDLDNIKNPDLTYGWSKLTLEYLAKFAKQKGIKTYIFRPFSGYGEDQDLTYPFPSFIKRAIERSNPFEIWGDGEQVRDFIHIDDIVGAVMKAVELDIQEPINLGDGKPTSFNELKNIICEIAGYAPLTKHIIDKPKGVDYRCSDNSKMLKFYEPKITLEKGIKLCLQQMKKRLESQE